MTEKKLLQQLSSLKSIELSAQEKKANRDILFSQISNTFNKEDIRNKDSFFFMFKNLFSVLSQPLLVVAGFFVFISGTIVLSSGFYQKSKPNDSFYIARIISEKARINTTFSQSEREALALKFASDHAKDIATILMDPEFNIEENKDKVEKLNTSFKNEISKVRTQIEKNEKSKNEIVLENNSSSSDELVFSASSLTEGSALQIYIPENNQSTSSEKSEAELLEEKINNSSSEIIKLNGGQEIIDEIEKLFAEGKYQELIEKLKEVEKNTK